MRRLFLLRHTKSSWDNPDQRDFDRPLNPRGAKAAQALGRYFTAEGIVPDAIFSSTAVRTRETLAGLLAVCPLAAAPAYDDSLYLAAADTLLEAVHRFDPACSCVLLVGHNPGLEDLALSLAGHGGRAARAALAEKVPTGALIELTVPGDDWRGFTRGTATLARFVCPRQLDRALDGD